MDSTFTDPLQLY